MKIEMKFFPLLFCTMVLSSTAFSQSQNIIVADDRIVIDVLDRHPLSTAIQLLASEYPADVTYEDPKLSDSLEIEDITFQERGNSRPDAPRILVPRMRALSIDLSVQRGSEAEEASSLIQRVLDTYSASVSRGEFRISVSKGVTHVIPIASRGEGGASISNDAILDTRITIAAGEMDGLAMFSKICEAVSIARGGVYDYTRLADTPLKPHRLPQNVLRRFSGVLEAEDEPARDVFMRVLRNVDEDVAWLLFASYDPIWDNYWVSARPIPREGVSDATSVPTASSGSADDQPAYDPSLRRSPFHLTPEELERFNPENQQ